MRSPGNRITDICTCCDGKGFVSIFKVQHTCGKCRGTGIQPGKPVQED